MTGDLPAPPGAGTVTVVMPYWRTPGTVRRAVDAVLDQTHTDLRLWVINDGDRDTPPWPHLADVTDPRLVRFDLPDNRGRYFCDATAIAAAPRESWIAIHDSDDWAEPTWLQRLLGVAIEQDAVAAVCPQWLHFDRPGRDRPDRKLEPIRFPLRAHPGLMRHLAHHAGVYRTDVAQHLGGHPGYRIGFDTLWINLMTMVGTVAVANRPLFNRGIRAGSLTTSPDTGMGSAARRLARASLADLYARCLHSRDPAAVLRDDVPADLATLVRETARRLHEQVTAAERGRTV